MNKDNDKYVMIIDSGSEHGPMVYKQYLSYADLERMKGRAMNFATDYDNVRLAKLEYIDMEF